MECICKRDIKMKSNAVQSKNTISGVFCSSRSFEHIFPAILKTVHSDKSNGNKQLTVSINHNRAMHSPKLFSALSLIQSNMYYQTKKCIPEILLDIIMYNSYISLQFSIHENFCGTEQPFKNSFVLSHVLKTTNYYRSNI